MPMIVAHQTTDAPPGGIATHARLYPRSWIIRSHRHRAGQLVYARAGTMTVRVGRARWLVPPQRAVWVPPGAEHAIRCDDEVAMRTLYLGARRRSPLPPVPAAIGVTPLLRELVLDVVEGAASARRLALVLALLDDEIARALRNALAHAGPTPAVLPEPKDPALRRIWTALQDDPSDRRTLAGWARSVGASERTLLRRCLAETGTGFRAWRRLIRLHAARDRLDAGEPVASAALASGYDSPSAFAAAFKELFGEAPREVARAPSAGA